MQNPFNRMYEDQYWIEVVTTELQRIWRLRKLHQSVDAELCPAGDEIEVRFLFNGALSYAKRCPTRKIALEAAAAKRAELEREGWSFHW